MIGNLPYNISTPWIFHLLEYAAHITDMHFMLQKEVVDRLAAKPATEHYGRLSIMVQYHCNVQGLFTSDRMHLPLHPKWIVALCALTPHKTLPCTAHDYLLFANIVKTAFSHLLKTLRNCLKQMITDAEWETIPLDSSLRPEQLSLVEYVKLSNLLGRSLIHEQEVYRAYLCNWGHTRLFLSPGNIIKKNSFDPQQDQLWFTGDLVNRGPKSLETLRFVKNLGKNHHIVLGNHDLHLLALAHGVHPGWPEIP